MKIIEIDLNYEAEQESVIALGNFDGVHRGHIELISKAIENAKKLNIKSSLLLFNEHTDNLVKVGKKDIITTNKTKFEILENLGVDIIYLINFTREFMSYSPIKFLDDFLAKNLKIKGVVVGYDYTYGYKKSGDVKFLKENKNLFKSVEVIDQVSYNGEKISSSLIRNLIEDGNIVYDTDIIIKGKKYRASTNIGTNPTVEHDGIKIEAHILDFNEDIYGEIVELELLDFVRPELKFNSLEELFDQIAKDVLVTRNR